MNPTFEDFMIFLMENRCVNEFDLEFERQCPGYRPFKPEPTISSNNYHSISHRILHTCLIYKSLKSPMYISTNYNLLGFRIKIFLHAFTVFCL